MRTIKKTLFMDYYVIILYPDASVCGAGVCRKSVDEVFKSEDGEKVFHFQAIAFNVSGIEYIPRVLFLLQAFFCGEKYTESGHDCLTWSTLCYGELLKGVSLPDAPDFFLDVIADRTRYRFDAQKCLCFAGMQAEYENLYYALRNQFV